MKKSIRNLSVLLLALTAFFCTVLGLTACNSSKVERLEIENVKTTFVIGDEFDLGEYRVYAYYTKGNKVDVTEEVEIRKDRSLDMNVAGDYQIIFSFGGKQEVVYIYVNNVEPLLLNLAVDTAAVKTEYVLGDEISYDGLKVISTYQNAQGVNYNLETHSLKEFTLTVTDAAGTVVTDEFFSMLGNFTVTVSKGTVSTSYTVNVSGVNISTVQGAVAAGRAFKSEVKSGTQVWSGTSRATEMHVNASYEYEFGNNYANLKTNSSGNLEEFFYGVDAQGAFAVRYENGKPTTLGQVNSNMINGAPIFLWYSRRTEYGVEAALVHLYNQARVCTNNDLIEDANEKERSYTFIFSGLVRASSDYDYYETYVNFTLGEKYNVEELTIVQDFYENNSAWADAIPTFITDENGITRPNGTPTYITEITAEQVAGERTAQNPYNRDSLNISDYKITINGEVIEDGDVIKCNVTDGAVELILSDIDPEISSFIFDPLSIMYDNGYNGFQDAVSGIFDYDLFNLGFSVTTVSGKSGGRILITLKNGGKFNIVLKTVKTQKTLTFDVTGLPPASMTSQVYNSTTGLFYDTDKKTVSLTGSVTFYGSVGKYANAAQTASVVSDNAQFATIENVVVNGVDCFKFSATQNGVYTVEVVSAAAPHVNCTFTFTVSDMPDFENILTGTYKTDPVSDTDLSVYTVTFTPATATDDNVSGSVVITRTPTNKDGGEETETLNYAVDFENIVINLTHASGSTVGADLVFSDDGELMIEDKYGRVYKLNKV